MIVELTETGLLFEGEAVLSREALARYDDRSYSLIEPLRDRLPLLHAPPAIVIRAPGDTPWSLLDSVVETVHSTPLPTWLEIDGSAVLVPRLPGDAWEVVAVSSRGLAVGRAGGEWWHQPCADEPCTAPDDFDWRALAAALPEEPRLLYLGDGERLRADTVHRALGLVGGKWRDIEERPPDAVFWTADPRLLGAPILVQPPTTPSRAVVLWERGPAGSGPLVWAPGRPFTLGQAPHELVDAALVAIEPPCDDGKLIAGAPTGRRVWQCDGRLAWDGGSHELRQPAYQVLLTTDGRWLASSRLRTLEQRELVLLDLETGESSALDFPSLVSPAAAGDDWMLYAIDSAPSGVLVDGPSGTATNLEQPVRSGARYSASRSGRYLAATGAAVSDETEVIVVLEMPSGEEVHHHDLSAERVWVLDDTSVLALDDLHHLTHIAPDGKATPLGRGEIDDIAEIDGGIAVLAGGEILLLEPLEALPMSLALHPPSTLKRAGAHLFAGCDRSLLVLDPETAEIRHRFDGEVTRWSASPGGIAVYRPGSIDVYAEPGREPQWHLELTLPLMHLELDNSGRTLVQHYQTSGPDLVRVSDLASGEVLTEASAYEVSDVELDDDLLVLGSGDLDRDFSVHVHDLSTGAARKIFDLPPRHSVGFRLADGRLTVVSHPVSPYILSLQFGVVRADGRFPDGEVFRGTFPIALSESGRVIAALGREATRVEVFDAWAPSHVASYEMGARVISLTADDSALFIATEDCLVREPIDLQERASPGAGFLDLLNE